MPISPELIAFIAVFALFALINRLLQRRSQKGRAEREAAAAGEVEAWGRSTTTDAVDALNEHAWGSGAAYPVEVRPLPPVQVNVVPAASMPPGTERLPSSMPAATRRGVDAAWAKRQLRTPAGLRRAVVLMTILEPCRALRPYEATGPDKR
jgi:hypothetical protein